MRALAAALALVATPLGAETIQSAAYDGPTTRYPHAVLGDAIEHDTLTVTLSDGRRLSARWDAKIVFEDTEPRLADLDLDGDPEVIVVQSHESLGAQLAIWAFRDGALMQIAATPFIGTRFRWLAPVGAADLDGDGAIEIAYVDRPHLAKTLRVWRFENDRLTELGALPGVTNHRIGEPDIAGGIRECGEGPEMLVADANWTRVLAVRFDGSDFSTKVLGPHEGRQSFAQATTC